MAPKRQPTSQSQSQSQSQSTSTSTTTNSSLTSAFTPTKPSSTSTSSSSSRPTSVLDAQEILNGLWRNYLKETPQRVKLIDSFMAFLILVGGFQFLYAVVGGNYVRSLLFSFFSSYRAPPFYPIPFYRRGGFVSLELSSLG